MGDALVHGAVVGDLPVIHRARPCRAARAAPRPDLRPCEARAGRCSVAPRVAAVQLDHRRHGAGPLPRAVREELRASFGATLAADTALWAPIDLLCFWKVSVALQTIFNNAGALVESLALSYVHKHGLRPVCVVFATAAEIGAFDLWAIIRVPELHTTRFDDGDEGDINGADNDDDADNDAFLYLELLARPPRPFAPTSPRGYCNTAPGVGRSRAIPFTNIPTTTMWLLLLYHGTRVGENSSLLCNIHALKGTEKNSSST
jgi:hypothetical protein